jgi:hypothetical protein
MKNLKGWRTVAINVGIAAGTAALPVLAGVDWTALVGPKAAVAIVVAINLGLRAITTSPVGKRH